ncbi:MAG: NADH-quinone oxidoreductase subunit J [Campylobacter sp.]|uniref:NADH-quinone oxidoreductase subunit J n=1 Tax=Campylobacter sp. JMF_04 NA10 TaxID=2983824 RepID=UPI001B543E04|nr:NADH-quinone oxidoreductase subunit J [Campylobacter sp. JMF_04 NA10]MBP3224304.1 NADH-quinone oxidoreductase subunit J [Campylobacter sp.]MDA3076154.1 NADH-quinone oxidoreductase subunit J [Campylobacter sp. JMF_04 NA10]
MIEAFAFYFFAILTLGLFSVSVFSRNLLYAMSALAGGMIFLSGFFFLLGAEFLGVVQIIVYTGAVMVLYGFSLMFFDASKNVKESTKHAKIFYTLAVFIALLLVLIISGALIANDAPSLKIPNSDNIQAIGTLLFTKYLLIFEVVAIMLLVAMICAIVLTHKQMDICQSYEESAIKEEA